jgi:predicted RND superfamily exporter protein
MKNPFAWFAMQVNERPLAVAIVAAAIFLFLLIGLTLVAMQTGNDTYLDPDSPRGAMLAHYTDTYSSDAMMLIFESADITSPVALTYIDSLQEDITNEQAVDRVSGVVNMLKDGNDGTLPSSSAEVDAILARSPPEIVARYMPSKMMTISAITLRPGLSTDRQKEVLNSVRTMVARSTPPPGMTVIISGEAAFSQEMEVAMGSSMGILIMAAMLLMVLAVFLLFSHVRYQLLPVVVVGCGLLMTFGFMGLAGIPISMVVIGASRTLSGSGSTTRSRYIPGWMRRRGRPRSWKR